MVSLFNDLISKKISPPLRPILRSISDSEAVGRVKGREENTILY